MFVFPDDGIDDGGWWIGWCPLHDEARDPRKSTARYNFKSGVYKCTRLPEPCHAPKKGMSLVNLLKLMAERSG